MNEILIVTGGVLCAVGVVFHGLFWRMFDWQNDLKTLSVTNRSLMANDELMSNIHVLVVCDLVRGAHQRIVEHLNRT